MYVQSLKESPVVPAIVLFVLIIGAISVSVPNLLRSKMVATKSHLYGMAASAVQAAEAEPRTLRTGSLMITVTNPAETAEKIRQLTGRLGGFLVSSESSGSNANSTASLSIRVPANRFEEAQSEIRKFALRIDIEKLESKDVTKEYVDRAARIRNLQAEEAQYLQILKRAASVKETLEVTAKLDEVRGEIERRQAEFNALSEQIETVALAISLMADQETQVFGLHWRPLYQLKFAARQGLDSIADYATTMALALFYLPAILLWISTIGIGAAIGWRILRWAGKTLFLPRPKAA